MGEVYSRREDLKGLGIRLRRVRSNLDDVRRFRQQVSYIPGRLAFESAGTGLLKKLVAPLYGDAPEVGVRELLQNAIDAVGGKSGVEIRCRNPVSKSGVEIRCRNPGRVDLGGQPPRSTRPDASEIGLTPMPPRCLRCLRRCLRPRCLHGHRCLRERATGPDGPGPGDDQNGPGDTGNW